MMGNPDVMELNHDQTEHGKEKLKNLSQVRKAASCACRWTNTCKAGSVSGPCYESIKTHKNTPIINGNHAPRSKAHQSFSGYDCGWAVEVRAGGTTTLPYFALTVKFTNMN